MPLPRSEDVEQLVTDEPTDGRNVSHAWAQPEAPNTVSGAGDEFVDAPPNATHLSRVGGNGHTAPLPAKSQQKHKYGPAPLPERLEKLKGSALQKHEEAQMRRLFNQADADGSGTLGLKEIKQLCKELGERISNSALEEGFYRMDPEKTGVVGFESFKKWWRQKEDNQRREMRKNVADVFNMMDVDGNGSLDREEIGLVAQKIAKKYGGAKFDPPFDLDTDYAAMDTTGTGVITYNEFAAWFKVRTGDDEPEIPVLPEYMVEKVKTMSDNQGTGSRSGKDLWHFLRARLSVIVKLQGQWGSVHDLYGTGGGTLFDSQSIPDGVFDPDSSFMQYWDLVQYIFLTYIILVIPIRVGFSVEVPLLSLPFVIDVIIDVFFIIDIYINFNMASWLPSGVLETNPKKIRKLYLKGWFLLDFISAFPFSYILLASRLIEGDTTGLENGYQRLLRLFKIARFTRLRSVLKKYEDSGVIGDVTPYLGSASTIAIIFVSGHFLTCLWYSAGDAYGTIDCDPTHEYADILGRIGHTECVEKEGGDGHHFPIPGWVILQEYPAATTIGTKYIDSMYSVFKSKFAFTGSEMKVSILSELVLGLIFGSLAGLISSIMVTLGAGDMESASKMLQLRAWMRARDLKTSDRVKILGAFNAQQELAGFDQSQILKDLPPSLSADISFFMYGKYIERIPIFRNLGKEVIAETCRWVRGVSLPREQIVYQEGKYGTEMYLVVGGEVEVSCDGERLGFLSQGAFFGERPLIDSLSGSGGTGSSIRTRTVRTLCRCDLGVIYLEDVDSIVARYPELKIRLRMFGLVGKNFSSKGKMKKALQELKSDLIEPHTTRAEILVPPSHGGANPVVSPLKAQLDEERARNAAQKAQADRKIAALQAEVETMRQSSPPTGRRRSPDRRRSPGTPEKSEQRMSKGVKTAFLPDGRHFASADQAAAAVLRAQSQVIKAQADLLRACAYSPSTADAALAVQSNVALSDTILASLLQQMNHGNAWGAGDGSSESMRAKANLAQVMSDMGDPSAAQPVFDAVVSEQTAALGADHLETLQTKRQQALSMIKAGSHSGGQELLEEVIAGQTKQLSATHLTTVETTCVLASSLRATGQRDRARELYKHSIEALTAELGPKHATTLTTCFNLASLLDEMDERQSARKMYEDIVEGQNETLGADHPETLATMYNLADLLESREFMEYSSARDLFVAVAAGYTKAHGPEHAETQDANARVRRVNFRFKQKH